MEEIEFEELDSDFEDQAVEDYLAEFEHEDLRELGDSSDNDEPRKVRAAIVSVSSSNNPEATGNELGWVKFEKKRRCGGKKCKGVCVTA